MPEPAPAASGIPGPGLPAGVRPLSIFGRTVGGSFFVEWDESPWGPYREVGLLSGLVAAAGAAWGGWASHVWVDKPEAAEGGRKLWGLPTSGCAIDVQQAGADGRVVAFGPAPLVHIGDGVGPLGRIDRAARIVVGALPWPAAGEGAEMEGLPWPLAGELSLPNLSGGLPSADPADVAAGFDCQRIISYPLRLRPQSARLLPGRLPNGGAGVIPRVDFSDWFPLFSVELRDVGIDVGSPKALRMQIVHPSGSCTQHLHH